MEVILGKFSSYKKAKDHGGAALGRTPPGMEIVYVHKGNKWYVELRAKNVNQNQVCSK